MKKPRIVIVGSGGAALSSAIEAAKYDVDILVLSKSIYKSSHYAWSSSGGCTWKAHGFNAAFRSNDSVKNHILDTIKGGAFTNNKELVEILCGDSVKLIEWLKSYGVSF